MIARFSALFLTTFESECTTFEHETTFESE